MCSTCCGLPVAVSASVAGDLRQFVMLLLLQPLISSSGLSLEAIPVGVDAPHPAAGKAVAYITAVPAIAFFWLPTLCGQLMYSRVVLAALKLLKESVAPLSFTPYLVCYLKY
jgi:hypothetical protein